MVVSGMMVLMFETLDMLDMLDMLWSPSIRHGHGICRHEITQNIGHILAEIKVEFGCGLGSIGLAR